MSIKLEYSTTAQCSTESVWRAFTETNRWPEWSQLFAKASWIEGESWKKDSKLLLEIAQPSAKLKTTIAEISEPNRAVWTGNVMGVAIEHKFDFTAQPEEQTLMQSSIELSGPATFFINDEMKNKGLDMFKEWFDALKSEAEKLAAEPAALP
jgi:hypothetical protein